MEIPGDIAVAKACRYSGTALARSSAVVLVSSLSPSAGEEEL
jgi:hypothetical protein